MSRSKHKINRYMGEKLYHAEVARRRDARACEDVAKAVAAYEEEVAFTKAA